MGERRVGQIHGGRGGGGGGVSVYASFFFSIFIQRDIVELLCNVTPPPSTIRHLELLRICTKDDPNT